MKNRILLALAALSAVLGFSSLAYGVASAARRPLTSTALVGQDTGSVGTAAQDGTPAVRQMKLLFLHQYLHNGFQVAVEEGVQEYLVTLGAYVPTGEDAVRLVEPRQVAYGKVTQTIAGVDVHYTLTRVGNALVAAIPKSAIAFGASRFRVGAWDGESNWLDDKEAFYLHEVDFELL